MVAVDPKEGLRAEALARRVRGLRSADKHRDWRVETVDVFQVRPLDSELEAFIGGADASLAGLGDLMTELRHGKDPGPLTLVDRGKDGLWLDPSTHDLAGSNSVALLIALRRNKKTEWPALVYKDKVRKQDEGDDEGDWQLDPEDKKDAQTHLRNYILGVMAGITLVSEDDLFQIAVEGARYGGGGLTTAQLRAIAQEALDFNAGYMDGFQRDALDQLDEILAAGYLGPEAFLADAEGLIASVAARAEKYAAGGNLVWVTAIGEAAQENGNDECYWNCTFGPGSCTDCLSLHGQRMTWEEFYDTFGDTICDGGCNCGPVPVESDAELGLEDLNIDEEATA